MFKRVFVALAVMAFAIVGLSFSPAQAAPSTKSNPLTCFDGASEAASAGAAPGTYGYGTCARKGNSFTLTNPGPGDYSGVYVENQSLSGQLVRNLGLTFTYSGTSGGGSPRFSIPLSAGGYVYVDAACDANLDGIVNLQEPGCIISDSNGYYGLASDYTGTAGSTYAFIVADQPGTVVVS